MMMGDTMGRVIFQKASQEVAPSTWAASYRWEGMALSPEMNNRICSPLFQVRLKILDTMPVRVLTSSSPTPTSSRICSRAED